MSGQETEVLMFKLKAIGQLFISVISVTRLGSSFVHICGEKT